MTRGLKPTTIVAGSSPVTKLPTPPAYLSKDAKAEWRNAARILIERRVLTDGDLAILENYALAFDMMRQAAREVKARGIVLANGKRNPASTALTQSQQQHTRAAGELGLTPAARSRAVMAPGAGDDDDFL